MVNWNQDSTHVPWLPVHSDGSHREPVAPSKPAVPATPARRVSTFDPEPIELDDSDSDIIAAVIPPPPEEILPTDGRTAWEAVPVFTTPTNSPAVSTEDPFRSLGNAAVARASLSASGAPTPLGGVAPATPSASTGAIPTLPAPAPTTPGAPDVAPARASAAPVATVAPGFMVASPPTDPESPARSSTPELEDEAPPFTPSFGTPTVPHPAGGDANHDDPPPTDNSRTPWWRSWPVLVLVGLLVMGGIAYAIVQSWPEEEPVELTPQVVVGVPEEATHDPISIDNPTDFQAALPQAVGLYSLTGYEVPDVESLDLTARVAEVTLLTYEYQETILAARAVQHFDVETAMAQFEEIAADGTGRAPVLAGGTEVGERVTISATDSDTVVWRNATAIFSVTGPADAVQEFFANFTL